MGLGSRVVGLGFRVLGVQGLGLSSWFFREFGCFQGLKFCGLGSRLRDGFFLWGLLGAWAVGVWSSRSWD